MKLLQEEIIVQKEDTLLNYLFQNISGKSKNNIKSLLSRGNVYVNNKNITQYDYPLKKGQKIVIKLVSLEENVEIIYEDSEILVVNKPAGLLTIATEKEKDRTLYHILHTYLKKSMGKVFIIHRLDRDTSGIVIFAKNESIQKKFQNNWNNLVQVRGYVAVTQGKIKEETKTIHSWLKENKALIVYSSNRRGDGKEAITHYRKLSGNDQYSLLQITIDTGRKNQIRVHLKDIGYPIIGDTKYGAIKNPLKRLGLHANILEIKHPINNKILRFEVDIPKEFKNICH